MVTYTDGQRVDPLDPEGDWRGHLAAFHPGLTMSSWGEAVRAHQAAHIAAAFQGIDVRHWHGRVRADRAPRFGHQVQV